MIALFIKSPFNIYLTKKNRNRMPKKFVLVVSMDNQEILDSIINLLEPFRQEVSISVKDSSNHEPMLMAHMEIPSLLRRAVSQISDRDIILIGHDFNKPILDTQKRSLALKDLIIGKTTETKIELHVLKNDWKFAIEEENNAFFFKRQESKSWGSRLNCNHYQHPAQIKKR